MEKKIETLKNGIGNGLIVSYIGEDSTYKVIGLTEASIKTDEQNEDGNTLWLNIEDVTPHLFPLSHLVKHIRVEGYNGGEEFVPIEVIGKLFIENGEIVDEAFCWDCSTGGDDFQDYSMRIIHVDGVLKMETWCGQYYEDSSYLIEVHGLEYTAKNQLDLWHFNTENLDPTEFIDASESKVYEPK